MQLCDSGLCQMDDEVRTPEQMRAEIEDDVDNQLDQEEIEDDEAAKDEILYELSEKLDEVPGGSACTESGRWVSICVLLRFTLVHCVDSSHTIVLCYSFHLFWARLKESWSARRS